MHRRFGRLSAACLTVCALAAGGLTAAPTAAQAAGSPTFDGPATGFVTPGPLDVKGTDPGDGGATVTLSFDSAAAGTATVQPDGTWAASVDTSGLTEGEHGLIARFASGTLLFHLLWVNQDTTTLQITDPAPGTVITDTTGGCVNLTGHLTTPGIVWNFTMSYAWVMVDGVTQSARVMGSGDTMSVCVPVDGVANGPATMWLSLYVEGRGAVIVGRVPVTLDLTTSASPAVSVGSAGITLSGGILNPGPDTVLTASVDGDAPVTVSLSHAGPEGEQYGPVPWSIDERLPIWQSSSPDLGMYPTQVFADGPHTVRLSLTGRGATTDLGAFPAVVDGSGHLSITGVTTDHTTGVVSLVGSMDNLNTGSEVNSLWLEVNYPGLPQATITNPFYTISSPERYGHDTWSIPDRSHDEIWDGTPTLVRALGFDQALNPVCAAVTVTGTTLTPTACGPTFPGAPTGVAATAVTGTGATFSFTPPGDNGGSPVTSYTATVTQDGVTFPVTTFTSPGATPTVVVHNLTGWGNLRVAVTAHNAAGTSQPAANYRLYDSSVNCSKPRATTAVGTVLTISCVYDNGLRSYTSSPPVQTVWLQALKPHATTWVTVASANATPAATTAIRFRAPMLSGTWYFRLVAGTRSATDCSGYYCPSGVVRPATSALMSTVVTGPAPKLTFARSAARVRHGTTVRFAGTSNPWFRGQRVYLQRYAAGAWRNVAYATLTSTRYAFGYRATVRGTYRWRAWTPAGYGRPAAVSASAPLSVV